MKLAVGFLLLFLAGAPAQGQLAPQPLCNLGSTKTAGYAFRLGDRSIIATGANPSSLERMLSKKWGILHATDGWNVDASKCITLAECSYVPLIDDGQPVPAYEYQQAFTLQEGEELLAFSSTGKKIRGKFSSEGNSTSTYSSDQGLRALRFKCVGVDHAQEVFKDDYMAVTKSDGRRVVGTRYSYLVRINSQTKTETIDMVFEPLLLGSPSFRTLPSPTSNSVFGYSSPALAVKSLARWISSDFFALEHEGDVSNWRKSYRIDKRLNDFGFSGCILAPINRGTLWSNGKSIIRFHLEPRDQNSNDAEPVNFLDALLDVFGQPLRADKYAETGYDVIVLRFGLKPGSELLAGLSRRGPAGIAVGPAGIPRTEIVPFIGAREAPLPVTRAELRNACLAIMQKQR